MSQLRDALEALRAELAQSHLVALSTAQKSSDDRHALKRMQEVHTDADFEVRRSRFEELLV